MDILAKNVAVSSQIGLLPLLDLLMKPHEHYRDIYVFFCLLFFWDLSTQPPKASIELAIDVILSFCETTEGLCGLEKRHQRLHWHSCA